MKKALPYILLTALLFATLEPVSKLISGNVNPLSITFIRFFIGGLILLPFSIMQIKKKDITLTVRDILSMALLGIVCVAVSMPLLQFGVLKGDSPALVAVIFSSNSVFTVILAAVFLKEQLTIQKILAVILCVFGILVCFDFTSRTNILSAVLAVLAALTFSLYTIIAKKLTARISGVIQTGISFCIGSVALLIVILFTTGLSLDVGVKGWSILLYLGAAVTGAGYWAYFRAMEKSSAMAAALVFFIKPVLTPFCAFIITGTPLNIKTFAALILVVSGSVLASNRKNLSRQQNHCD